MEDEYNEVVVFVTSPMTPTAADAAAGYRTANLSAA